MLEQLKRRGDLNFSFSGLKTAVVMLTRAHSLDEQTRADVAAAFQEAVADVLVAKSLAAVRKTSLNQLVVAGGVGANVRLRALLDAAASGDKFSVFYPAMEFCTDNGAMIALAGCLRLKTAKGGRTLPLGFTVRPRWDLASVAPA
jgi:N6-L-threonylcarbamoyladenine synthase